MALCPSVLDAILLRRIQSLSLLIIRIIVEFFFSREYINNKFENNQTLFVFDGQNWC